MVLLCLDDFTARSSDELSLARGDRVELVERDDDFGDGWYLGRHLTSNATGLFPQGEEDAEFRPSVSILTIIQSIQNWRLEALRQMHSLH